MNDWKIFELSELTSKIGSGATPRGGQEAYKSKGIYLIRSQNILDFSFSYNGLAFIDDEQAYRLRNVVVENDDILINITGDSVARTTKVPKNVVPARVNQHVAILRVDKEKLDSNFLLYYLLNPVFKKHLLKIASDGATRNALTKSNLENLNIKAPENVIEQKAIAKVLTAFDDKIENLRAQNQTLEQTAQTIFKEWFRKYQVGDELPEGWGFESVEKLFNIFIGRTPPRKQTQWFTDHTNGKKWISIKDMGNSGAYIYMSSENLTDAAVAKFRIPIIPKNSVILSFKMTVGEVSITTEDMLSNEAIAHFIIEEGSKLNTEYIYCFLQNLDFNSLGSTSSIVTAVNSKIIKSIDVLVPDDSSLLKFNLIAKSVFSKIRNNTFQIQSLSQTRDTVLPKLMRGELRVNAFKN